MLEQNYKVGDTVFITEEQCLENYGEEFLGRAFKVEFVSTSNYDHPGFDSNTGTALYDLEGFGSSLYDWELQGTSPV